MRKSNCIIILNSIMNIWDIVINRFLVMYSNLFMKITFRMRGVFYEKDVKFYGKTKIKRSNSSKIVIGKSCTFRSRSTSNLIGVNRPCILAAIGVGSKIIIGQNCGFSGTVIGCFKEIKIGDNVKCGANTLITDSDWHPEDSRSGIPREVIIKTNVWLGVNVTVLKGVTIGENSIIGAGSVVTKDIPANVIAAGNPCKVIRRLDTK